MNKETDDYGRPNVDPKGSRTYIPNAITKHNLLIEFEYAINEGIEEIFECQYNYSIKDMEIASEDYDNYYFLLEDMLFDLVGQSQYVIYTNKSKEVVELLNYYTPFCIDDMTGQQFKNWNQCALASLHLLCQDNFDLEEMAAAFLRKKRAEIYEKIDNKNYD
tara:strand:- start:5057 stop:5542 length:486 start_codon:yes stop_codon:yes gene_type:complete